MFIIALYICPIYGDWSYIYIDCSNTQGFKSYVRFLKVLNRMFGFHVHPQYLNSSWAQGQERQHSHKLTSFTKIAYKTKAQSSFFPLLSSIKTPLSELRGDRFRDAPDLTQHRKSSCLLAPIECSVKECT